MGSASTFGPRDTNTAIGTKIVAVKAVTFSIGTNNFVTTKLSGIRVGKTAIGVGDEFGKYNLANLAEKPTWPGQAPPGQVVN